MTNQPYKSVLEEANEQTSDLYLRLVDKTLAERGEYEAALIAWSEAAAYSKAVYAIFAGIHNRQPRPVTGGHR